MIACGLSRATTLLLGLHLACGDLRRAECELINLVSWVTLQLGGINPRPLSGAWS